MQNIDYFNEYAIQVLNKLYERFPCAVELEMDDILDQKPAFPTCDAYKRSYAGDNAEGIYVGPDSIVDGWPISVPREKLWEQFDWDKCIKASEQALGRELDDNERDTLLRLGVRPFTAAEAAEIAEWKVAREQYWADSRSRDEKERILSGTIQFLVHEGIVRHLERKRHEQEEVQPSDFLIDKRLNGLRFTLTNKGLMRMNKEVVSGDVKKGWVANQVAKYVADKAVDSTISVINPVALVTRILIG